MCQPNIESATASLICLLSVVVVREVYFNKTMSIRVTICIILPSPIDTRLCFK